MLFLTSDRIKAPTTANDLLFDFLTLMSFYTTLRNTLICISHLVIKE